MSSYLSLEARLHDIFWETESSPEFGWLDELLTASPGPALEIGCGSGRLLLPLIANGHRVEGLDPSPDMLDLCRRRAGRLRPVLHRATLAEFRTGSRYRSLLVPAFTFQLLTGPADDLRRMRDLLSDGGLLYLTVFRPFAELQGELPENEWYPDHEATLFDGTRAILRTRHRLDRRARLLHREHHYRLEGSGDPQEQISRHTLRWFDPPELSSLLAEAGFVIEQTRADFEASLPVGPDSQILTLIARKKSGA